MHPWVMLDNRVLMTDKIYAQAHKNDARFTPKHVPCETFLCPDPCAIRQFTLKLTAVGSIMMSPPLCSEDLTRACSYTIERWPFE